MLVKEDRKNQDPSLPDTLESGSCGLHAVHRAFQTAKFYKMEAFEIIKTFTLLKQSSIIQTDYLTNDLADSHINKKTEYLFPEEYCCQRWRDVFKIKI